MRYFTRHRLACLAAAVIGFILLSPKWTFAPAAWVAPAFILMAIKDLRPWKAYLTAVSIFFISGIIGNWGVFPFPTFLVVPINLQIGLLAALPYLLTILLLRKVDGVVSVLVFPSLAVLYEFLNSFSGSGTLGSIAYTQADNLALIQLASLTGIWGISFLIYWASSLIFFTITNPSWRIVRLPALTFGAALFLVLLFGAARVNPYFESPRESVRLAGITAWNIEPLQTIYRDAFGRHLEIDPSTLTQQSPELAELNKALAIFIEDPFDHKFRNSHQALRQFHDSLFAQAEREARAGAKIISFSEALMFTVKPREDEVITKAREFCKRNKVRLLLTLGTFLPGKIEPGAKFIENKAILVNADGELEEIFFKNKPVPLVEASVPGDGEVPVRATGSARLALSICYDADFPPLMRKAGIQRADIMLLPSGDWKEISPMHGDVARFRAIENGFSLLRPVSGATSVACDFYGRKVAVRNFYETGDKVVVASLPVKGKRTVYTQIGDVLPWLCLIYLSVIILRIVRNRPRLTASDRLEAQTKHPERVRQD